jgi:ABC-type phosphate transport system substrate-binding protein
LIRTSLIAILILILGTALGPDVVRAQEIAVIGHPDVPEEAISKALVLDFFTGDRRRWSDEEPVVPLDLQEPKEVRKTFYKSLGKSSSRMRSIWMRRKLSGEGEPPEAIDSERELLLKVASTPGAIGFVRRDSVNDQVKLLAVL